MQNCKIKLKFSLTNIWFQFYLFKIVLDKSQVSYILFNFHFFGKMSVTLSICVECTLYSVQNLRFCRHVNSTNPPFRELGMSDTLSLILSSVFLQSVSDNFSIVSKAKNGQVHFHSLEITNFKKSVFKKLDF